MIDRQIFDLPPPRARLSLGVTGHRADHPGYAVNVARIEAALNEVFDAVAAAVEAAPAPFGSDAKAQTRLHSMLVDGTDQIAARSALARGWELVAPLPFGRALNEAINAAPTSVEDARALLTGGDGAAPAALARISNIRELSDRARVFELADNDDVIAAHFLAKFEAPGELARARAFDAAASRNVAMAARVLIEQSDFVVAVWDGDTQFMVGGTGHTIAAALERGAPVVWIDTQAPEAWRILRTPESLATRAAPAPGAPERIAVLQAIVRAALVPDSESSEARTSEPLLQERWRSSSSPVWHLYRRIEALFGGEQGRSPFRSLRVTYETPEAIVSGSAANVRDALRMLPEGDPSLADAVERHVLRRFAWADGVSAHLSDVYRGGMVANFILSSLAIIVGIAYLPFATSDEKGYFAAAEFVLLASILVITWQGQKRRWHGRWFETRRVAEYFRHSPLLLALGVARPPGRWPQGAETSWPEWYARQGLREVGLPRAAVTRAYLYSALKSLLDDHVVRQRDYHYAKAKRLTAVHRNLDRLSEALFVLAVVSVALFLGLTAVALVLPPAHAIVYPATKAFTFLGVMLPTFGASIAGIRYFGDFERFAAISEVTAEKLTNVHARVALLLAAGEAAVDYSLVCDLAHDSDDIVVSEIENWQAVFGGKHVTVPV